MSDATTDKTYRFHLPDLTCASCQSKVEKVLQPHPAIKKFQLNFPTKMLTVVSSLDETSLIKIIAQSGFTAHPKQLQCHQPEEHDQPLHYFIKAIIAGGFGTFLMWLMKSSTVDFTAIAYASIISIFTLIVMIFAGKDFYYHAIKQARHGQSSMDTLISIGTLSAWFYSSTVVFWPNFFQSVGAHPYFESAVMILAFINLGKGLEARATLKTQQATRALIDLRPKSATWLTAQGQQTVALESIQIGWPLLIKPGETIPVDGTVIEHESYIDESMLTGEAIPIHKTVGDNVTGGTLNKTGSFTMRAEAVGEQTRLAQIIQLIEQASSSKPKLAKLADKISSIFVPVVLVIALVTAMSWWWWAPYPKAAWMLSTSLSVLVIACPCALGLAAPIAVMVCVTRAARLGVLIKSGNAVEKMAKLTTVIFDKTGTLTQGKPTVDHVVTVDNISEQDCLTLAASIEYHSEHPTASAIVSAATQKLKPVEQFKATPGKGVQGLIDGEVLFVGHPGWMAELKISTEPLHTALNSAQTQGLTVVCVAKNQQLLGIIGLGDAIRPEAKACIDALKKRGLRPMLVTGDNQGTADAVAKALNIDTVHAHCTPEDKCQLIQSLQQQGQSVAMIGDGINDAPALKQADVSLAIGTGTDVAIASGDLTLMGHSLTAINRFFQLAHNTLKIMRQNFFGAFIYNLLAIPLAAGLWYPISGHLLNPMVAAGAMALSSLTVVFNSLRIK